MGQSKTFQEDPDIEKKAEKVEREDDSTVWQTAGQSREAGQAGVVNGPWVQEPLAAKTFLIPWKAGVPKANFEGAFLTEQHHALSTDSPSITACCLC